MSGIRQKLTEGEKKGEPQASKPASERGGRGRERESLVGGNKILFEALTVRDHDTKVIPRLGVKYMSARAVKARRSPFSAACTKCFKASVWFLLPPSL